MKIYKFSALKTIILTVVFAIAFPALLFGTEKKLKPDGIILHSSDCTGPDGKGFGKFGHICAKNYHFIVKKNGIIQRGAPEERIIKHVGSKFNNTSLSVLVEGSFGAGQLFCANDRMPVKQEEALKKLLFMLMDKYDIPLSQIERHRDNDNLLSCPGYGFPYFELLYSMSKSLIKEAGNPLLEDICKKKGISLPLKSAKIYVDKSDLTLSLYEGEVLLKSYRIGLSNKPQGDKLRAGDRKTPVGTFYICEKYPTRAWMEFSYPDVAHAKVGLTKKIIDQRQYDLIVNAVNSGSVPFHGSAMGNDVGMHAGGFPYGRMRTDYTAGCVGLEDPEAFEIYNAVPIGSSITIME